MELKYLKYPSTVKLLAEEIKKVCNDYYERLIGNKEIEEVIVWYASMFPEKLFEGDELNPTITKIIGKKRVRLINGLLESKETRKE